MKEYEDRIVSELKRLYPNLFFKINMYEDDFGMSGNGIMLDIVVYKEKDIVEENDKEKTIIASELSSLFCYYKTIDRYEKEFKNIIDFCKKTIEKDLKGE